MDMQTRIGRNDPCPCGSGLKFKKCCMATEMQWAPIPTYYTPPSPPPPVLFSPRAATPPRTSAATTSQAGMDEVPEHVFVKGKGWTHKNELTPGDECKVKDGSWAIFRPDLMNGTHNVYVKDKGWIPETELQHGDQYQVDGVWVTFAPERVIGTTHEHPFYVKDKGWTKAGELKEGDLLRTADGWVPVSGVKDTGRYETVYNLRVADYHTYFVGASDWGFAVWAHNTCYEIRPHGADGKLTLFEVGKTEPVQWQAATGRTGPRTFETPGEADAALKAIQRGSDGTGRVRITEPGKFSPDDLGASLKGLTNPTEKRIAISEYLDALKAQQEALGKRWSFTTAHSTEGGVVFYGTGGGPPNPANPIRNVIYIDPQGKVYRMTLQGLEPVRLTGKVPIARIDKEAGLAIEIPH